MATRCQALWGLTLLAIAAGSAAQLTAPPCSNYSYWGENFYHGATVLGQPVLPDVAACCNACRDNSNCGIYTYCSAEQSTGCLAPNGPYAGQPFPAGTCLLSKYNTAGGTTILVWSYMEPGTPWSAGEYSEAPVFVRDASDRSEDFELLGSSGPYFCRKISGGSGQMTPVNVTLGATGAVMEGQQVMYTGLAFTDPATNSTAGVVLVNDTKSLWSYPADSLAYCDDPTPGCTPGPAGGRTEQGASCQVDADCCAGLVCRPRGVAALGLLYRSVNGSQEVQQFLLDSSTTLRPLLPNECVQLDTGPAPSPSPAGPDLQGPRYDRPTYLSVPVSYCLYFDTNCTGLEAANYFCANVTTSLLGTSYTAAADFSAPLPVPPDPDPRAISTVSPAFNITCSSHYSSCSTFEYITCA